MKQLTLAESLVAMKTPFAAAKQTM